MDIVRLIALFVVAAVAEIGGAWLVWQGVREDRGLAFVGAGVVALGLYGFVATFQPDPNFGRILAAYGGVFVVGSLACGRLVDWLPAGPLRRGRRRSAWSASRSSCTPLAPPEHARRPAAGCRRRAV